MLIVFIGLATFGFGAFGMHTGMQSHDGGCVAATTQGVDCPNQSNPTDYFSFHLNAFKDFSTATPGGNVLMFVFALTLLVVWAILKIFVDNPTFPKLGLAHSRRFRWEFFKSSPKREFIRWLSLHENSPAFS